MKKWQNLLVAILSISLLCTSCSVFSSNSNSSTSSGSESQSSTYTVHFFDKNGKQVYTSVVKEGATAVYRGEDSVIADYMDYTYVYTFKGWDKSLSNITANTDFHPVFEQSYREYVVTFYAYDGETVLKTVNYHFNDYVIYDGVIPTRTCDVPYSKYEFIGWKKKNAADTSIYKLDDQYFTISSSISFVAQFELVRTHYVITYKNGDEVLQEVAVPVGEKPQYTGETPTKEGPEGTYTFIGWEGESEEAPTGDATYQAKFSLEKYVYTVVFYDDDRTTVLATRQVEYGTIYTQITPAVDRPTKESDSIEYNYVFSGWDYGDNFIIKSDASIYAVYRKETIQRHVEFRANGGYWNNVSTKTKSEDVINGRTVTTPAVPSYDYGVHMNFLGYSEKSSYKNGDELIAANTEITITKDTYYYAIWQETKSPNKGVAYGNIEFDADRKIGTITASKQEGATYKKYGIKSSGGQMKHTDGKFYNSYVTSIDDYGWYEDRNVEAIYIAENTYFDRIGKYAFQTCSNLTEIELPSNLKTVGASAFKYTNLPYLVLPETVTFVGDDLIGKTIYFKHTSVNQLPLTPPRANQGGNVRYNTRYTNFAIYSENQPGDDSVKYWHYVDDVPTLWS